MLSRDQLHPYQRFLVDRILTQPSTFAVLEMGMGKTAATLTAIRDLYDGFGYERCLIIAPKRVAEQQWPAETKLWTHLHDLTLSVVCGTPKQRLAALAGDAAAYVVSRDNVKWLVDHYKKAWPFDFVVIDESSSFKSHSSQRFKSLRRVRRYMSRVVLLTGTPVSSKGLLDLWSQACLLDGGERLGSSITRYRAAYFDTDYMGYNYTPKDGADETVMGKLADVMYSMRAEDYLDMPERRNVNHWCAMQTAQQRQYKRLMRDYVLPLRDSAEVVTAANAAVLAGKLLQLSGGAIYTGEERTWEALHDEKIEALAEILEQTDDPLLVCYMYQHERERIVSRFSDVVSVTEPGAIDSWNGRKLPGRIMLCHPQSAGHGLNLQYGGRRVVWFTLPWSLELYQQTNARLHRQGQRETVFIHHILTAGTIDEQVARALDERKAGQDFVIDAVKEVCDGV